MTMYPLLRRLAEMEPGDEPVLSVYLDMRPHATGGRPALRDGVLMMGDRLREIEKTFGPRGHDLDSFRMDVARIEEYLQHEFPVSAQGLAIFACAARGLFETVEAGVPFEHQVTIGPVPDLFQLARLADDQETAVVGVVNFHTARLFVMRTGFLREIAGTGDTSVHYRKTMLGGLNQKRYQRHVENHRAEFAREAAAELERVVEHEDADRVILAGNESALPLLLDALSPRVSELVHGQIVRVDVRAPRDAVAREIEPILAQAEAEEGLSLADQLVTAVRSGGLGVDGLERTRAALEHGQVDVLLLDADAPLGDTDRNELIRLAAGTGADVEVVQGHAVLRELGGVGALLRYQHDAPTPAAV